MEEQKKEPQVEQQPAQQANPQPAPQVEQQPAQQANPQSAQQVEQQPAQQANPQPAPQVEQQSAQQVNQQPPLQGSAPQGQPAGAPPPPPPPPWQRKIWLPPPVPQQPPQTPREMGKNTFQNCLYMTSGALIGCLLPIIALFFLLFLGIALSDYNDEDPTSKVAIQSVPGFEKKSSNYIAVIPVHGVIMNGKEGKGIITPKQFATMMEKAEKDKSVKAVIISIDSPGGEVNAADEIYRTILKFRERTNRPVVAMMRSIAASGGYYVAAGCDKIVAADMTLTGSIGVIISSYNVTGLLDKIGVKGEVYKSGEMKDMLSPTRPRTPEEQAIVQSLVKECYDKFAGIVADSRKIPLEKITKGPIGDGRVYHGAQALSYGLVDELGQLEEAISLCERLAKLSKGSLSVKSYNLKMDFVDMLFESNSSFRDGIKVDFHLPGNKSSVELEPGRLYFLPAGL